MNKLYKIKTAIKYINLLNSDTQAEYDETDDSKMTTLYYQLVDESNINDLGDMRYIEISKFISKTGSPIEFEFFDISVIFGRVNSGGDIDLFYTHGETVTQLDWLTTIYPVNSQLSCAYNHPRGITLTATDAQSLNIEIE